MGDVNPALDDATDDQLEAILDGEDVPAPEPEPSCTAAVLLEVEAPAEEAPEPEAEIQVEEVPTVTVEELREQLEAERSAREKAEKDRSRFAGKADYWEKAARARQAVASDVSTPDPFLGSTDDGVDDPDNPLAEFRDVAQVDPVRAEKLDELHQQYRVDTAQAAWAEAVSRVDPLTKGIDQADLEAAALEFQAALVDLDERVKNGGDPEMIRTDAGAVLMAVANDAATRSYQRKAAFAGMAPVNQFNRQRAKSRASMSGSGGPAAPQVRAQSINELSDRDLEAILNSKK